MNSLKNTIKKIIQEASFKHFVYKLPYKNTLFLTFDDGPNAAYTPQLLDILRRYNARATFFLVGKNVEQHPDITLNIKKGGHRIGLHTYSHKNIDKMNKDEFEKEILLNQQAIANVIKETPVILRPPQGRLNSRNLLWAILNNITIVHYTITSNDWKLNCADDILNLIRSVKIEGGEIISFHDSNTYTIEAMPQILHDLKEKGFSFSSIF